MISLFILNSSGEFVIEKHFCSVKVKREEIFDIVEIIKSVKAKDERKDLSLEDESNNNIFNLQSNKKKKKFSSVPSLFCPNKKICIFTIEKNNLFYIAASKYENACPLTILEILDKIHSVFSNYFGKNLNEQVIRTNFSSVYLLLDEMIDGGNPSIIESNILEMLVPIPSIINRAYRALMDSSKLLSDIAYSFTRFTSANSEEKKTTSTSSSAASSAQKCSNGITGLGNNITEMTKSSAVGEGMGTGSGVGPGGGISGCGSHIWWRKGNTNYSSNEIYVDIIERLNCIVDDRGNVLSSFIDGKILINSKLSGIPEVNLILKNPFILSSASFHPSVKFKKLERDEVISFCPPDGESVIANYWLSDIHVKPPLKVKALLQFSPNSNSGHIEIKLASNLSTSEISESFGRCSQPPIEELYVYVILPQHITSANLSSSIGNIKLNSNNILLWKVDKINSDCSTVYRAEGTLNLDIKEKNKADTLAPHEARCACQVSFVIKGFAISGLKLDTLDVTSTNYSSYKGCRYSTVSGLMEFRM